MQQPDEAPEGQVAVTARPLPYRHLVRLTLPNKIFDSRRQHHAEQGIKDPEQSAAIWTIAEIAEKFEGRPVVWIENDSVVVNRHHDRVNVAAIVTYMPKVLAPVDLAATMRKLVAWEREEGRKAMMSTLRNEVRNRYVERNEPVEDGDLVMVELWNTGLQKGASVTIVLALDSTVMPDLTNAIVGKSGGHTIIGSYPIVVGDRRVRAQKVLLHGKLDPKREITDEMVAENLEVKLEDLPQHIENQIVAERTRAFARMVGHDVADVSVDPIPVEVAARLAEGEARRLCEKFGQASVMRRYGVRDAEELVEALIETSIGLTLKADIVCFWEAKKLNLAPSMEMLQDIVKNRPGCTRVEAVFLGCREMVAAHYLAQETTPAPPAEEVRDAV